MPALVLKQAEVLQRIAVDDDDISEGTRLDAAKFALVTQQFGADGGCRSNDLERRQHFGAEREFLRLLDLQLAEQIGAVGDGNAVAFADFE